MDLRDFFRGFFGRQPPQRGRVSEEPPRDPNLWPPPPPIPEFNREDDSMELRPPYGPPPFWSNINPEPSQGNSGEEFEGMTSHQFVFGNLFSALGQMFQEMERSMRDMDRFFGNIESEDGSHLGVYAYPPPGQESITASQQPGSASKKDENVRDLVLKENDTPHENRKHHYLEEPQNPSDKVDRDLDVLYENSMLDLSELPVPSSIESQRDMPQPSNNGLFRSFSQRTFQTHTFRNGRMEGEIVREDATGKHVTKYYTDENGQKHESTEFIPREGFSNHGPEIGPQTWIAEVPPPPRNNGSVPIIELFDRLFKPRM